MFMFPSLLIYVKPPIEVTRRKNKRLKQLSGQVIYMLFFLRVALSWYFSCSLCFLYLVMILLYGYWKWIFFCHFCHLRSLIWWLVWTMALVCFFLSLLFSISFLFSSLISRIIANVIVILVPKIGNFIFNFFFISLLCTFVDAYYIGDKLDIKA